MINQSAMLMRHAPYFPVKDVEKAGDYYQKVLGFEKEYSAGEPLQFAIFYRDDLAIMLRLVSDSTQIVPNEAQGGTWDVFFWVSDVHSLFAEFQAKGATFVYGVTYQEAYNMDEFAIRDLNGYVLGFGQSSSIIK